MSVIKKVLPLDQSEHQGGVDAVLLKTVWVCSSTNDNENSIASMPWGKTHDCVVIVWLV